MTPTIEGRLKELINAAQQAEAFVAFTAMKAGQEPYEPAHKQFGPEFAEKEIQLRTAAQEITDKAGIDLVAWEATQPPFFTHLIYVATLTNCSGEIPTA